MKKFDSNEWDNVHRDRILKKIMENQCEIIDFLEYTHPKQFEQWQHSIALVEETEETKI